MSYSPIARGGLHILCLIAVYNYSYIVIVYTFYVYTTTFVVYASLIPIIKSNVYYLFSLTLQCNSNNIGPECNPHFFCYIIKCFLCIGKFAGK